MNLVKAKLTTRKFYNKWLYKVSLTVQGSYLFRTYNLDQLIAYCDNDVKPTGVNYSYLVKYFPYRKTMGKVARCIKDNSDIEHSIRIERDVVDIYTNDQTFYTKLCNEFSDIIRMRFEPDPEMLNLLEGQNVIVKKYPHDRYRHRVYLQPHKMAGDKEGKQRFVDWLKGQDSMTCTPAIESWFITTDYNWDRRYILVEDEKALLMLKLRGANVVGTIHNFVISDK